MSTLDVLSPAKQALLAQRLRGQARAPTAALRPSGLARFPLSPEQRHIWLHAALVPDAAVYNEGLALHRHGSLDVAALERALGWFVARHEIWRTRFDFSGPEPEMHVEAPFAVRVPLVDLRCLPAAAREAEALRLGAEQVFPPYDLNRLPLFRVLAVQLAEDEHRLYIALHHFIFDGVSIGQTLLPELALAYAAFAAGHEPVLGPPAVQYGDYVLWRRGQGTSERHAALLARWQEILSDAPVQAPLPDRAADAQGATGCIMRRFALPAALVDGLRALGHAEGATLYQTLLAAFALLLSRWAGGDLLIGTLVDMRRRPEFMPAMGYILNTVPIRLRFGPALSFRMHLGRVRIAALDALDASELPFEHILRALAASRSPAERPVVHVLFSMQPEPQSINGWELVQMEMPSGGAKFDLTLEVEERGAELLGRFIYAAGRFAGATIHRMVEEYTALLGRVVADPDAIVGELGSHAVPTVTRYPRGSEGQSGNAATGGVMASRFRNEGETASDRGGLPRIGSTQVAERTGREERLAAIWREILGVQDIGPEDDFFALGGHSLLVPAVLARVAAAFGRAVPVAQAFRTTTLRAFADLIDQAPAPKRVDAAARALMLSFESLGDDCEFGFVQRRYGAEPLSLLRFTGIGPERLAEALEARFEGFDDPALLDLRIDAARDECWIDNRRYDSSYLVFGKARASDGAKFIAWEARKIGVLRKQLLTQLAAGHRICVLKCNEGVTGPVVERIAAALAAIGPTPLLWVAEAGRSRPPGEVEWTAPGLLRGWIDRLAPRTAPEHSSPLWLDICRRARELHPAPAARAGS